MASEVLVEDPKVTRPISSFPAVVLNTLSALSLTGSLEGIRVLGSGARRAVLFPSDVDAYAIFAAPVASKAKAAQWAAARFQHAILAMLELPSCFLGDVKCGRLVDCQVLNPQAYLKGGERVVGYSMKQSVAKVRQMHAKKLLTDAEAGEALQMLEEAGPSPSPDAWFALTDALRYEVVRWSLPEIKAGKKEVRGGRTLSLAEAWMQPNIAKVDAVVFNSATARYMDVSVIYELHTSRGELVNNAAATALPLQASIGTDVLRYALKGKHMKVVKRMLSLATLHKKHRDEMALLGITNTAAGALYAIAADAGTCAFLVEHKEHFSAEKMKNEVDAMKARVAGAQDVLLEFPELEAACNEDIDRVLKAKTHDGMLKPLEAIADVLSGPVSESALQQLKAAHLWPPPKWALP